MEATKLSLGNISLSTLGIGTWAWGDRFPSRKHRQAKNLAAKIVSSVINCSLSQYRPQF